jgi:hypothetical protein
MKCTFFLAALLIVPCAAKAQKTEPKVDEDLRKELQKRVDEDQAIRNDYIKWLNERAKQTDKSPETPPVAAKMEAVDKANTQWLKDLVAKHGWPGKSLVGKDGAHNAWLLVQHADRDREFQKKCLELLKAAAAKDEVSKIDLAYLTDRVLVADNKKQLYGTQFKDVNGKWEPSPIEDEANVDKRRKEVGLGTMAEYRKMIEQMYGPKK